MKIQMKNRDNLGELNELISVDIENKDDLLAKHKVLNVDNEYLHFGLMRIKDKYYFFEVDNFVAEYKLIEGVEFLCPYCKQPLFTRTGWTNKRTGKKVRDHLCHYSKDVDDDCIFRTTYKSRKLKKRYYQSEGFRHKFVKENVCKIINEKGIKIELPYSYKIDKVGYEARINFEYREVFINKCDMEKKVLRKDELSNGYIPDIVAYNDNGDEIYIEITNSSGKTVNDYGTIWKRLNTQVLEVKVSDFYSVGLDFINLYSPTVEMARVEYLAEMEKLAGQKKLFETILLAISKYKFCENIKSVKAGNKYKYFKDNGDEVKTFWKCITLNGYSKNMKVTFEMVRYMWEEGLKISDYKQLV